MVACSRLFIGDDFMSVYSRVKSAETGRMWTGNKRKGFTGPLVWIVHLLLDQTGAV